MTSHHSTEDKRSMRPEVSAWFSRNLTVSGKDDDNYAADPLGNLEDSRKLARHINSRWRQYGVEANCTVVAMTDGRGRSYIIRSDLDKKLNFWGK